MATKDHICVDDYSNGVGQLMAKMKLSPASGLATFLTPSVTWSGNGFEAILAMSACTRG